jgi:hypothetical protein
MAELFYEGCLYGKPIVDLCLYHAAENPFNRVERILYTHYGIQVDRDTVQRYAELFAERVEDRHGVTVADETYPGKKGAKKELRAENARRKAAGWTQKPFPDGFYVASAYLSQLDYFASLQCWTDFAWLLAATLVAPSEDVDY